MWSIQQTPLIADIGLRCTVSHDGAAATVRQVVQGWQTDAGFRTLFNRSLAQSSYSAFRWETPSVTAKSLDQAFEFVVLDRADLDRRPDASAFSEYFASAVDGVAVFPNLRGDAVLVVPSPIVEHVAYGHLAAFVRRAPEIQQQALWQAVGAAMSQRVNAKPVWLSTAGAGVPWLHVRLDDRPKYYHHAPYAR